MYTLENGHRQLSDTLNIKQHFAKNRWWGGHFLINKEKILTHFLIYQGLKAFFFRLNIAIDSHPVKAGS